MKVNVGRLRGLHVVVVMDSVSGGTRVGVTRERQLMGVTLFSLKNLTTFLVIASESDDLF